MTTKLLTKAMEILQGNITEQSIASALIQLTELENQVRIIKDISYFKTEVVRGLKLTNESKDNEIKRSNEEMIVTKNISKSKSEVIQGFKLENKSMSEELSLEKNMSKGKSEVIQGYKSENKSMAAELTLEKNMSNTRLQLIQGLKFENRKLQGKTEKLNDELNKIKRKLADTVSTTPKRKRNRSE